MDKGQGPGSAHIDKGRAPERHLHPQHPSDFLLNPSRLLSQHNSSVSSMSAYQARRYLRQESMKKSEGTTATEPKGGRRTSDTILPEQSGHKDSSSVSHPPVLNRHCSRRLVQGRRDTCSPSPSSSPQGSSGSTSDAIRDKIENTTLDQPLKRSSTFHPPVMSRHCARMFASGRRDSCSGVRHPFFEEPGKISFAQEMWKSNRDAVNDKPKANTS